MSLAPLAHSVPPQTFKRDYPSLLPQSSRQQRLGLDKGKTILPATDTSNRSMAERAPTTRQFSVGDSSDDELPEPMKFSALTRALLEEGVSVADGSGPSVNDAAGIASPTPEQQPSAAPRRSIQRSPNSFRTSTSSGSPPRRVVRLSAGSSGSATLRKGATVSKIQSPAADNVASRNASPQDWITPAARPRSEYLKNTAAHPAPLSDMPSTVHRPEIEDVQIDGHGASLLATAGRHPNVEAHDSAIRYGSISINRPKYSEESGLQSSIRIKRVGKVSGSFLSGPARRGRRRQSEEDNSPMQEDGHAPPHQYGVNEDRGPSPDLAGPDAHDPRYHETHEEKSKDGPHVTFATGSPGGIDGGEQLRSTSPVPKSSRHYISSSSSNKSSGASIRPVFKVPPPPPSLPSKHDQENDPPPTFKRNKSSSSALQSIIDTLAVPHEGKPAVHVRTVESPQRRVLANRSQNTPLRPAPPPPRMSVLETATATAGAAAASQSRKKRNHVSINGKVFQRVSCIGRGGSSRVYKVMAENDNFLAFKKVSFEDADEATVRGYKGEIDLLKKLYQVGRVINLIDWEINEEKHTLSMVSLETILLSCDCS